VTPSHAGAACSLGIADQMQHHRRALTRNFPPYLVVCPAGSRGKTFLRKKKRAGALSLFRASPQAWTDAIMNKRFMLAAATASLVFFGASACSLAAPPEHAAEHHEFSAEDKAALTDAGVAALKAGLKMSPAQEKNWPALEVALRDVAKARAARMAEWHEKAKEAYEHPNLIEKLYEKSKALSAHAAEMEKIADAAKPLYDSLDDAQKRRFGMLLRAMARMHGHVGQMWHMGRHEGEERGE
jgi:hypothetical protein